MIVTVYRSDCYLFRGDWLILDWSEFKFHPVQPGERETKSGYRKVRDQPLPYQVKLPPLARFDGQSVFPSGDLIGVDATATWSLAVKGERGFKIQEASQ